MQSFLVALCWTELVALIVGAGLSIAVPGGSDAAGRAMAIGYVVIGVTALVLLFVVPALVLASTGRVLWLAATLSAIAAIPAFILAVGSVFGAAEHAWRRLRRR